MSAFGKRSKKEHMGKGGGKGESEKGTKENKCWEFEFDCNSSS
jgi:hypothetical protein